MRTSRWIGARFVARRSPTLLVIAALQLLPDTATADERALTGMPAAPAPTQLHPVPRPVTDLGHRAILATGVRGKLFVGDDAVFSVDVTSNRIRRFPRSGGPATEVGRLPPAPRYAFRTNENARARVVGDGSLFGVFEPGTLSANVAGGEVPVAIEGSPTAGALDATHIYWARAGSHVVTRRRRAGGASESLYTAASDVVQMGLAGDELVVATHDRAGSRGELVSIPRGGGAPSTLARVASMVVALAFDERHVYFATRGAYRYSGGDLGVAFYPFGSIQRVPRGGGGVETLATDLPNITGIALTASSVLVTTELRQVGGVGGASYEVARAPGARRPVAREALDGLVATDGAIFATTTAGDLVAYTDR